MNTVVNINIKISDEAAKAIMWGAVVLGIAYIVYRVIDKIDENAIPLPPEAKDFAHLPEVMPESFELISGHEEVKQRSRKLFQDGHYVSAVREAAVAMFDVIRKKSGVQDDGTTLIQKSFRGANRVLQFVNVAPPHITNAEDGLIGHMESFAKYTRNVQMHASVELTVRDALLHINLACYLADQVERHAVQVGPKTMVSNT